MFPRSVWLLQKLKESLKIEQYETLDFMFYVEVLAGLFFFFSFGYCFSLGMKWGPLCSVCVFKKLHVKAKKKKIKV